MKDLKLESLPRETVSQEDLLRMQRRRAFNFHFRTPEGNDAEDHGLSLHGVEFSHDSSSSSRQSHKLRVKKEVRFSGNSRSVLLGKNGSGKSTFLDLCAGKLKPIRGSIDRTQDLKIGYYSQVTEDLDRNSTDTAASYIVRVCHEELGAHAGSTHATRLQSAVGTRTKSVTQQKRLLEIARGVLSHFGFEGDVAVSVPVDRLSGGQKALLKFAVLSLQPAHILLLDEPTNHLDAEACEALAKGLSEFKGGVVAVTHDELLMYRLINCNWSASELLICRGGLVWSEKNFGAHCLKALKNEVHRAEEAVVQPSKKHQQASKELPASDEQVISVVTKKSLPPWLQPRRRAREKKDQPIIADTHPVERVSEGSVNNVSDTGAELGGPTPIDIQQEIVVPKEFPRLSKAGLPAGDAKKDSSAKPGISCSHLEQDKSVDAPDSWEEALESDASTTLPEDVDGTEELDTARISKPLREVDEHVGNCSSKGGTGLCNIASCTEKELELQCCELTCDFLSRRHQTV
jgi:ABC-type multidrug transport system ATPase subunit